MLSPRRAQSPPRPRAVAPRPPAGRPGTGQRRRRQVSWSSAKRPDRRVCRDPGATPPKDGQPYAWTSAEDNYLRDFAIGGPHPHSYEVRAVSPTGVEATECDSEVLQFTDDPEVAFEWDPVPPPADVESYLVDGCLAELQPVLGEACWTPLAQVPDDVLTYTIDATLGDHWLVRVSRVDGAGNVSDWSYLDTWDSSNGPDSQPAPPDWEPYVLGVTVTGGGTAVVVTDAARGSSWARDDGSWLVEQSSVVGPATVLEAAFRTVLEYDVVNWLRGGSLDGLELAPTGAYDEPTRARLDARATSNEQFIEAIANQAPESSGEWGSALTANEAAYWQAWASSLWAGATRRSVFEDLNPSFSRRVAYTVLAADFAVRSLKPAAVSRALLIGRAEGYGYGAAVSDTCDLSMRVKLAVAVDTFEEGALLYGLGRGMGGMGRGGPVVAPKAARSRVLLRTDRGLQKFFDKHGEDFGLTGNWNPSRAADASQIIHQHVNNPAVRQIRGTYLGESVTHHLDPKTGLNIIEDSSGKLVSGWKLGAEQLESVLTTGRLF